MEFELEWPTPANFEVIATVPTVAHNNVVPCVVSLSDGRQKVGELIRFDIDTSQLEFHPERAGENVRIGFSNVKSIRLTTPITLKRLSPTLAFGLLEAPPIPIKQKCVISFKDGDLLIAESIAFISHPRGLFLFVSSVGSSVLRWFIPAESITGYQIGDNLAEILIDEKLVSPNAMDAGLKEESELRAGKTGDDLQHDNLVTELQVETALQRQKSMPHLRLGEALIQERLITEEQLTQALQRQASDRKMHLGDILCYMGFVNKETLKRVLAQKLGIPFVSLLQFTFDIDLIKTVPGDLVRRYKVMPLYRTQSRMVVAMEDPLLSDALKALSVYTQYMIDPVMASEADLTLVISKFYGTRDEHQNIADFVSKLDDSNGAVSQRFADEVITESDNTMVRLVNKIIMDAHQQGASHIHIESMKGQESTRVRFRKDGAMKDYSDIPADFRNALISRLKIMSCLDISEKRRSQDGKINFEQFGPATIEIHVLTMPTTEGLEDIVMRMSATPQALSLDMLGLSPIVMRGLQKLAVKPHGLLFVCGPTGSGKTTTLHSLISYINTPERKIWTVEDPIEITQKGLRQVQVQAKTDCTFASILRSFLRADPDVIMVGETRDSETAKTVIEASLSGHMVFSTMLTHSAAESAARLLDLGMDQFNFADALLGVLSQRLTRKLCTVCCQSYAASDEQIAMLAFEFCFETKLQSADVITEWRKRYQNDNNSIVLHKAIGCEKCDHSGYNGRLGVHELLLNSVAIKRKIHAKANASEIFETAIGEGMRTLKQDGIEKILQGLTDWEQIRML